MSSQSSGLQFYHPLAFWLGCLAITAGVLAHVPMFIHASYMNYQMVGMPMDNMMLGGMALIPLGLILACYGLMPRLDELRGQQSPLYFHVADQIPLNRQHWTLVSVLLAAVIVDVMKPATLGFVMPGIKKEYEINSQTAGTLALVALTGTTIGSVIWGIVADKFGRRAAILLSALMFIGTAICGALCQPFEWNLIMCFLMGMSAGGLLPITFTLMAETIPAAHRGWLLVALGGIGTAGGYLVAAGSAAVLEPMFSWRVLWLLGLPTGLLLIVLNRYMPESPRFLASQGLTGQARAVLARFGSAGHGEQDVVIEQQTPVAGGISQLFQAPYAGLSIGLILAGVAWGLVNFGFLLWLPVNLGDLGFAAEASAIIAKSALMAIPAVLLVIWLYHSWSSIKTLWLFLLLTALSLGSFVLFDFLQFYQPFWLSLAIALLLVSASGVIAMLIPYAAEIYPVHLRASGSGLVAASSKFGGIVGAGVGVLGWFSHIGASALAIGLALLVAALVLQRKGIETRGKALEDMHQALLDKTR